MHKYFEVRDHATFIPVLAVKLTANGAADEYLLRRAGYARGEHYVMITRLGGGSLATCDPYDHGNRTMIRAHEHIINHWDELESGAVIDVEFIHGVTKTCKKSERLE